MKTNRTSASRRGWALLLLTALSVVALPVSAACNGNPKARVAPENGQSVNETTNGAPTVVQLNGTPSTPGNDLLFAWQYLGSTLPGYTPILTGANTATPTFNAPSVPTAGASLQFQLTVTCGSRTDSITTTVNVTDVVMNTPPTAVGTASPADANEGDTVTLDGTASYDSDPGTTLSYHWAQIAGSPTVTLVNADSAQATFIAPNTTTTASLTFRLTVSDGTLQASTDKIVNIVWTNDPPVASLVCPGGVIVVDEGTSVTVDGSGSSDSDGSIANYTWGQVSGLPNLDIGSLTTPSITFDAPHLGYHQLGSLSLRLTVTDNNGASSSTECGVFIKDVTAPAISVPADIIAEATSSSGAAVDYNAYAMDAVDDNAPYALACEPPSGSVFALAVAPANDRTTAVACAATDSAGNTAQAGFNITVHDTTAPVITAPLALGVEATGPNGAIADFSATTADAVDGSGDATCAPVSGSLFPLGDTTVVCNASDARGNVANAKTFALTVHDTTAPTIDTHPDVNAEATGPGGASVTYISPATHDIVDGVGTATCAPASGSTFPLGTTLVTCSAADAAGNAAQATQFQVTVVDTTAPVVTAPANVTAEATGPLTIVAHGTATATDAVGVVSLISNAPGTFPLGTTTITWTATDAAGNSASATSTVTVVDTTAPAVSVPDTIVSEATSAAGAAVSFSAWAIDLVHGNVAVACAPASGSTFALGTTTVTCSATDGSGNTGQASFAVTVRDTTAPVISYLDDVSAIAGSNSSAVVNYTQPTARDLVDGAVAVNCSPASGSTFPVGSNTVSCTATDSRGNTATGAFKVNVSYAWSGFFKPVDMAPTVNSSKAGSAVPLKFNLGGYQGMSIMAAGYPKSAPMSCGGALEDPLLETVTAGSSSLQYDASANQYIYVWKSEKSWAGTCRQIQVKLSDGSLHTANFSFK